MASVEIPPVVCNLTTGIREQQKLEWSDLARHALTGLVIDGGVESTFPLDMVDQIEDLVSREVACCGSWLQIAHDRQPNAIRLRLTTPNPEGVALIRSLSGF